MIYSLDDVENDTEVIVRFVNWGGELILTKLLGIIHFLLLLSETVTTGAKVNITRLWKQILEAKRISIIWQFLYI